jgi:hypothetical protein
LLRADGEPPLVRHERQGLQEGRSGGGRIGWTS